MNECMEDVDYWQKRSERYHDILVSIDYKIQQFGEEYIGPKDWNIGNLREGLSAHLPDVSKYFTLVLRLSQPLVTFYNTFSLQP